MIPVPWVNHLAVGPGLPLSASGESAPRPGAPELHFVSHMNISDRKASLRAGFFWLFARLRGGGLAFGLAFCARGAAQEPAGLTLGATSAATRSGRAAQQRPFTYCPTGRVGLRLGVSESASCLSGNGRPSRSAPCGPCPVAALAYATGPEGEIRRLFRILRCVGSSAPLALGGVTVLSAMRSAHATRIKPRRGMHRAMQTSARTRSTDAVPRGCDKRLRRQQLQRHWPRNGGDRQQRKTISKPLTASRKPR